MSIKLYKKGNTHIENGLECEIVLINNRLFDPENLPKDHYLSPEESNGLQKEEKERTDEEREKEILRNLRTMEDKARSDIMKEALYGIDIEKLDNKELRSLSRKCNIENWNDARFKTLRMELKKCQQAI